MDRHPRWQASTVLLLGHLIGVAVLAVGVGAYGAGLHRLTAAFSVGHLRFARPVVTWDEHTTLVGFVVILATGVVLSVRASAFADVWLLTSLALLVVVAVAGRAQGAGGERSAAAASCCPE